MVIRKVGIYAMHVWLMAMDESETYQAKDAAGFASETRMQISMCSGDFDASHV